MAFKKRQSRILTEAQARVARLKTFDAAMSFDNGLTLRQYDVAAQTTQTLLNEYNAALTKADTAANNLKKQEDKLETLSVRIRLAVASKFGKGSSQYEAVGGKEQPDDGFAAPEAPEVRLDAEDSTDHSDSPPAA